MFLREFLVVKNKIYTVKNPNLDIKVGGKKSQECIKWGIMPADEQMKGSMIDSHPLDQIYDSFKSALNQSLKKKQLKYLSICLWIQYDNYEEAFLCML